MATLIQEIRLGFQRCSQLPADVDGQLFNGHGLTRSFACSLSYCSVISFSAA